MTVSGKNVPKTKKSSLESFQSEQSKPSSKSSEANKKQNENSSKKVQETELREISLFRAVNPQAPVAQKVADEVVFRRFQGEGVEFFLIGPI